MITPSFNLTATERVLPKLALDFTTASLDNRITFTRALNTATRVNSSGFIETVNADTPRFDYTLNTGGACKGLLIEESRTNILTYSEDLTNIIWQIGANTSRVADQIVSPSNNLNADKITFLADAGTADIYQTFSTTIGTAYSVSIYLKTDNNEASSVYLYLADNAKTTIAVLSCSLTTNWQRFTITGTATSTTSMIRLRCGTGQQNKYLYTWGAQAETGAFATSYIPTTTTALTRNADVATITGTNFSDWFNASEGALWTSYDTVDSDSVVAYISDGTSGNSMNVANWSGWQFRVAVSASEQAKIDAGTVTINTQNKIAAAYKINSFAVATNGSAAVQDTSGNVPTVTQMELGAAVGGQQLNGRLRQLYYYPQRLTNAELQAFSK